MSFQTLTEVMCLTNIKPSTLLASQNINKIIHLYASTYVTSALFRRNPFGTGLRHVPSFTIQLFTYRFASSTLLPTASLWETALSVTGIYFLKPSVMVSEVEPCTEPKPVFETCSPDYHFHPSTTLRVTGIFLSSAT